MYQEPDNNIGVIGMVCPTMAQGNKNAGKVEYVDYLNDIVALDIAPTFGYETASILVLKPQALYKLENDTTDLSDIDKNEINHFKEQLTKQDDESKKVALKLAYDNTYLRALVVVDFRDYIEQEMEKHENIKRDRRL